MPGRQNGASSSAGRASSDSPRSFSPLTGGRRPAIGKYSTTASSMRCTPLFLNAEPHSIGGISPAMVRWRMPSLISASVSALPSRYLCISSSLASAADSTIFSRHSLDDSRSSAGISRVIELHALGRLVPVDRLHLDEVNHALEVLLGTDRDLDGTGLAFSRRRICSKTLKKFAPVRSILLTNASRGTPYLFA